MANGVMIVVHRTPRTIAARRRMELVGEVQDAILGCDKEKMQSLIDRLAELNYSAPLIEKLREAMR